MSEKKTCIVIRHGAYGDVIMATCLLPYLARDGYTIDFYTNDRGMEVLKGNPYVRKMIRHEDESIPMDELEDHWKKISQGYDLCVNLTGSIENSIMVSYPQPEYFWPLRKIRSRAQGHNFYDRQIEIAGYEPDKPNAELYLTQEEKIKGKAWRKKHRREFKIVWALSGSSIHKVVRQFEPAMREFLQRHEDAICFTVGDYASKILTFSHPRCINTMFWEMSFRDAIILTKYADLVVGPETGILTAAAAFKTPTVILLSHGGPEQITKYWENCIPLQAPCWCSPCYRLTKYAYIWRNVCQVDDTIEINGKRILARIPFPACTMHGKGDILDAMEVHYDQWKHGKRGWPSNIRQVRPNRRGFGDSIRAREIPGAKREEMDLRGVGRD